MAKARLYSIRLLEARVALGFRPALQMRLSINYNVDQWLVPSLTKLVFMKPDELSMADAQLIGTEYLFLITRVQGRSILQKQCMAYSPVAITHESSCSKREYCEAGWKRFWCDGFARLLLDSKCTVEHLLDKLGEAPPPCHQSCVERTVTSLRENNLIGYSQNEVIEGDIQRIVEFSKGRMDEVQFSKGMDLWQCKSSKAHMDVD